MKNKISDTLICIGRNVKKFRSEKNMTQQELAFYCENMDRSTVSNIERFNTKYNYNSSDMLCIRY